jgi:hypothetical protein
MTHNSLGPVEGLNLYILQTIVDLAQVLPADAMLRFGITRASVERLLKLNPAELLEVARSPSFLFAVDEKQIIAALDDHEKGTGYENMAATTSAIARALSRNSEGSQ